MHELGPSGSGQPCAKRGKVSNKGDRHTIGDAVKEDKKAAILKLDIDCGDNAFDYLTLEDLVSIGKTCKRMQQLAGYCFQQKFSSFASCGSDGITRFFRYYRTNVEHFAPFIQKIQISNFEYFFGVRSKFRRLKEIRIMRMNSDDMIRLKEIPMGKLEELHIITCKLNKNFHEIIDQCAKLRHLRIDYCAGEFGWLNCKYPHWNNSHLFHRRLETLNVFQCSRSSIQTF